MSKGSGRRNENTKLVEANWDKIFKKKTDPEEKKNASQPRPPQDRIDTDPRQRNTKDD